MVAKGYSVRAIRRSDKIPGFVEASYFNNVEWLTGNVLDTDILENAMKGIDAVIHAAALVSFETREEKSMYQTNVEGTANMVNAALLCQVPRFVYISSVASLGRKNDGKSVSESSEWEDSKLNTHYAKSKYFAEMEVWRGIGEGLNAVIVNPSTILGYGDWNSSSSAIFKNVYNEFPWYTNGINGFVAVEDVSQASILLMESGIENARFLLNGDNWSFQKLFNSIADGFGKKRPSREAGPYLSALAWRLEKFKTVFTGKKSLLTRESARLAQTRTYFDNSKVLKALPGFSFTALEQTIQDACKKYKAAQAYQ